MVIRGHKPMAESMFNPGEERSPKKKKLGAIVDLK